jgi:hypothetical protein
MVRLQIGYSRLGDSVSHPTAVNQKRTANRRPALSNSGEHSIDRGGSARFENAGVLCEQ